MTVRWYIIGFMVLSLAFGCASSPVPQAPQSPASLTAPYFTTESTAELIAVLNQRSDATSIYQLATIYDETGNPEQALPLYQKAILNSKNGETQYVATAAAIAIVAMRDRIRKFEQATTAFLSNISKTPQALPKEAVYQLRTLLFSFSIKKGNMTTAKKSLRKTGCITNWKLAGPFEPLLTPNIKTNSAFPLFSTWPTRVSLGPGRAVVDVKSKTYSICQVSPLASWSASNGVLYAKTVMNVPDEQIISFRLQNSNAAQVFIDKREVFRQDDTKKWQPNVTWFDVPMSRGRHEIIVAIKSIEYTPSFSLSAVTEHNSSIASDISSIASHQYSSSPNGGALSQPAKLKIDLWNNNAYEAYQTLQKMKIRTPQELLLHADWSAASPFYAPETGFEKTRQFFKKSFDSFPQYYRAALFLARFENANGRTQHAINIIETSLSLSPNEPSLHIALAEIFYGKGWYHQAEQSLNKAKRLIGNSCKIQMWEYAIAVAQNNFKQAKSAATQISKCNAISPLLAVEFFREQKYVPAANVLQKIRTMLPDSPQAILEAADGLFRAKRQEAGVDIVRNARSRFPLNEKIRDTLVDAYWATGKKADAISLLFNITESPLRHHDMLLREMVTGEQFYSQYRIDGIEVVKSFLKNPPKMKTDFEWILDRMVHVVDQFGGRVQLTHWIGRVNTIDTLDKYAEIHIPPGNELLQARTIKQNLAIIYPMPIENKSSISLRNLEIGDFVEFESVAFFEPDPVFLGGFDTMPFYFQDFESTFRRSEVVLIAPRETVLQFDTRGMAPLPAMTKIGNLQVVTFRARNSFPMKEEPDAPVSNEFLPSVRITSNGTNKNLCHFLHKQYVAKSKENPISKKLVSSKTICKGDCSLTTVKRKLYQWVQDNIQDDPVLSDYAAHIFSRAKGNRIRLYQTLLEQAGIVSQIGFVTPVFEDNTADAISSLDRIPYQILQLEDGTDIYLADDHAPYGFLPAILRNQPVLFPDTCKESTTSSGIFPFDNNAVWAEFVVDEKGNATGHIEQKLTGEKAVTLRQLFSGAPSDRNQLFEEYILSNSIPHAVLNNLKIQDLDNADSPLRLEYDVSIYKIIENISLGHLPLILKHKFTHLTGGLRTRTLPLVIAVHEKAEFNVTITLPSQYAFADFQYDRCANLKTNDSSYCMKVTPHNNTVDIKLNSFVNFQRVSPQEYSEFHEFVLATEQMNATTFDFQ